jgi:hypothetical protein
MKNDLNKLFGLDSEVLGCSHFVYLTSDSVKLYSREYFEIKFDVNLKQDFIVLYTAADPKVIKNEYLYIYDIMKELENSNIFNYKIIIRKNPMDKINKWSIFEYSEKIRISEPEWYYNDDYFFNYTNVKDLSLFKSLLKYSNVCINVPSTVTIECALLKLPILNICYSNVFDCDILSFWNADFYKNARNSNFVFPIFHQKEFKNIFLFLLEKRNLNILNWDNYLNEEIPYNDISSLSNTVKFILE